MNSKLRRKLPKSDKNERLERESRKALDAILSEEMFLPRKDDPDKGVDSSIEVIDENEDFTNFRAQIQIKGTFSGEINKDGSVSYPIETSNLRYLWNNLTSIYVLYIKPRKELRFIWLRDEVKRLDEEKPNWQNQDEVSLRFFQILNSETIVQIYEQIQKEGLLHRKIKETLTTSDNKARFEVDSLNLEVIDHSQAKKILKSFGIELINSNDELYILEKFNLLSEEDKQDVDLLLLKAMAESNSGKYRTALDTIGQILLLEAKLSGKQEFLFSYLENNCNWQLGKINYVEFLNNSRNLAKNEFVKEWNVTRFHLQRTDWAGEKDPETRKEKLKILQNLAREILNDNSLSEETKTGVEVLLLECEASQIKLDLAVALSSIPIYLTTGAVVTDLISLARDSYVDFVEWYAKANSFLERTANPIKQAEITEQSISLLHNIRNTEKYWMNYIGVPTPKSDEFDSRIEQLNSVIEIYTKYKQTYSASRAKILLADIYYFLGRFDESKRLKTQINELSKKMAHNNLVWTSENLISEKLSELAERKNK